MGPGWSIVFAASDLPRLDLGTRSTKSGFNYILPATTIQVHLTVTNLFSVLRGSTDRYVDGYLPSTMEKCKAFG